MNETETLENTRREQGMLTWTKYNSIDPYYFAIFFIDL